jgi:endonuclease/exonuclease/phosphatase family metal-dependent hydrolase
MYYVYLNILFFLIQSILAFNNKPLCPLPPFQKGDDVHINCKTDMGNNIIINPPHLNKIVIASYNIDRNGYGGDGSREEGLEPIINMFLEGVQPNGTKQGLPKSPDIILLSEAARGCEIYGNFINGPEQISKSLGMNWVYSVEYVVVSQSNISSECSIGNAILSKFPIININQTRFNSQCCRFGDRYGGRIALSADILIQGINKLSISSTHLESGQSVKDVIQSEIIRAKQAKEIVELLSISDKPSIIGGDMNSPLGDYLSPALLEFEINNWKDAHKTVPKKQRVTDPDDPLNKYGLGCFDYIFSKSNNISFPGICNVKQCIGFSDHLPIYATLNY